MKLSYENNDFLIKVVKDCYTRLQDENNILNETVRMFDEERTKHIITIQSLNAKLSELNKKGISAIRSIRGHTNRINP